MARQRPCAERALKKIWFAKRTISFPTAPTAPNQRFLFPKSACYLSNYPSPAFALPVQNPHKKIGGPSGPPPSRQPRYSRDPRHPRAKSFIPMDILLFPQNFPLSPKNLLQYCWREVRRNYVKHSKKMAGPHPFGAGRFHHDSCRLRE